MKHIFRLLIFLFLLLIPSVAFSASWKTYDTIAGFETIVKLSELSPGENVVLRLVSASGERKLFYGAADASGEARLEIPGDDLRKAGAYRAEFISQDKNRAFGEDSFYVYPDSPNPEFSGVYVSKNKGFAGSNPVKVTIRLQDQYGNGVEGHEVSLASSRSQDTVKRESEFTDQNGNLAFFISSMEPGVSVFTAYDQTEEMTFEKRVSITFEGGKRFSGLLAAIGGDGDEVRHIAQASPNFSEAASFEILDLENSVIVNENLSFRARALDETGSLVTDYTGTVEFSSSDPNAILPADYAFQPQDLGEHVFELSLSFRTQGEQTLRVNEIENEDTEGEVSVTVSPQRGSAQSGAVEITKPTAGTYGTSSVEIEGNAPPNSNVTLYDNGRQVGITRASSIGLFSFTISSLEDGLHTFSAEANGILSGEVQVTISAGGTNIEEFRLSPNPAGPSQSVEISLRAVSGLDTVSVVYADLVIALQPNPQDTSLYAANITAPSRSGNYPMDVQLVDRFGNESSFTEVETLIVEESLRQVPAFRVPSRVSGVRAIPGPSRVTLSWQPSTDDTGISYYNIYYGIDRNNLDQVTRTPDARTVWYIPNLEEGIQYFFRITGVDTEGNEGHQMSAIVGAVPGAGAFSGGVGSLPEGEFIPYPAGLPEDGPALWLSLAVSGFAALLQRRLKRR